MSFKDSPLSSLYRDKQEGSVVMFGGVDHRYYKGELKWVPLIEAGAGVGLERLEEKGWAQEAARWALSLTCF